ncbi:Cu/Zn superoxide dismutase-like protein [Venturia nashicola]|uniref:superoxide dismutase n=1 Tax=Venturia nashicola TaxID=86259 RepID=A0A4Z1PBS0_9PEZI|nr:Cu/Zn superoxide dismutase-like protein [Venturia nashicola]TLD29715.1 Cu/Zn superoxide dismutase-like protein [Venturia nashicola]
MKSAIAIALCASSVAFATDAPVIKDNPIGAQYLATMPAAGDAGVYAQFAVMSGPNGEGVSFAININGKSFQNGPFLYHIHEKAVPSDGNCTGTGAHLDPTARGETPPCDKSNLASCQVGDLSGKYGEIPTLPGFNTNYTDKYLSLTPGNPAFFGDKSVVLHFANKTRIACANFKIVDRKAGSATTTTTLPPTAPGGGGFIGSTAGTTNGNGTATLNLPTAPASTTATAGIGGAPATGATGAKPTGSALSAASGMKVKHMHAILGPVLLGVACMV